MFATKHTYRCLRPYLLRNLHLQGRRFSGYPDDDVINKKYEDFKMSSKVTNSPPLPKHADIVIIGGGAVGLSAAFWMQNTVQSGLKIIVIEKDPTYSKSSSLLPWAGLKQQYGLKELIQLSKFSSEFFGDIKQYLSVPNVEPPNIFFNHQGFLTLATKDTKNILIQNYDLQRSNGVNVEMLNKNVLQNKFPWMNVDDIELACYGQEGEGWFDPGFLMAAYRIKCASLGVEFHHAELVGFTFKEYRQRFGDKKKCLDGVQVKMPSGEIKEVKSALVVNCAGASAQDVAYMIGIGSEKEGALSVALPVEPRKRFLFMLYCPDGPGLETPIVSDTSGIFIRREGLMNNYLCGANQPLEGEFADIEDGQEFFEKYVGPALVNRIPAFKGLEVINIWRGVYDHNDFDGYPIISNHPRYSTFITAAGFNGEGPQLSPAIGRTLMEYFFKEKSRVTDMKNMFFDRIYSGEKIVDPSSMLVSAKPSSEKQILKIDH